MKHQHEYGTNYVLNNWLISFKRYWLLLVESQEQTGQPVSFDVLLLFYTLNLNTLNAIRQLKINIVLKISHWKQNGQVTVWNWSTHIDALNYQSANSTHKCVKLAGWSLSHRYKYVIKFSIYVINKNTK